jgi:hypothetical protein
MKTECNIIGNVDKNSNIFCREKVHIDNVISPTHCIDSGEHLSNHVSEQPINKQCDILNNFYVFSKEEELTCSV